MIYVAVSFPRVTVHPSSYNLVTMETTVFATVIAGLVDYTE